MVKSAFSLKNIMLDSWRRTKFYTYYFYCNSYFIILSFRDVMKYRSVFWLNLSECLTEWVLDRKKNTIRILKFLDSFTIIVQSSIGWIVFVLNFLLLKWTSAWSKTVKIVILHLQTPYMIGFLGVRPQNLKRFWIS